MSICNVPSVIYLLAEVPAVVTSVDDCSLAIEGVATVVEEIVDS